MSLFDKSRRHGDTLVIQRSPAKEPPSEGAPEQQSFFGWVWHVAMCIVVGLFVTGIGLFVTVLTLTVGNAVFSGFGSMLPLAYSTLYLLSFGIGAWVALEMHRSPPVWGDEKDEEVTD